MLYMCTGKDVALTFMVVLGEVVVHLNTAAIGTGLKLLPAWSTPCYRHPELVPPCTIMQILFCSLVFQFVLDAVKSFKLLMPYSVWGIQFVSLIISLVLC